MKTAQVYGQDSRYLLVKASSGDLVGKNAVKGFYLIVLHGHFVCHGCSRPPGSTAKPPRGKIATEVWSPKTGQTDFGIGNKPVAMAHLRGPSVVMLAAAQSARPPVAAERRQAAAGEAEQMLHEFVLPPGARAIQVRPGHYRNAHVLHQSPGKMASEVVSLHRFWSVRMPLKAVIKSLRAHRLHGFRPTGAMWYTRKPHYLAMGSVWPAAKSRLPSRYLTVTSVGLSSHKVLRIDAEVPWVYPRSPSEKVPTGVRMIDIHVPQSNRVRVVRVISAKVARIVHWFDALPVAPPGVHIPCFGGRPGADITLSFRGAHGALLAQARVPPTGAGICDPIGFRIGGQRQAPLTDRAVPLGETFVGRLQHLLGMQLTQNYR